MKMDLPKLLMILVAMVTMAQGQPRRTTLDYLRDPASLYDDFAEINFKDLWNDHLKKKPLGRTYLLYKDLAKVGFDIKDFDLVEPPVVLNDDRPKLSYRGLASRLFGLNV